MGKECKQVLNRLDLTEGQLKKTATILESLQKHCLPECNVLYEHYLFHNTEQQQNETIDQHVLRLHHLAEPCKFAAHHNEMLHD